LAPRVKIVTDSTAYLLPETIVRYDIRVVPLRVIFGAETYAEGVDITNDEFYRRLAKSSTLPTTSQPPASEFIQVYGELVQQGYPIFSIHISRKLSGTLNSALIARDEFPEAQIEVVDWLTMGFGLLVIAAARAAEEGQGLPEIKATIKRLITRVNTLAVLDTIEYLRKGGRIGGVRALVGILLGIKPILTFENGEAKLLAKVRTRSRAVEYMLRFMEERVKRGAPVHSAVIHTRVLEGALALVQEIRTRFNCVELDLVEFGPVFGTHIGPRALGLGFYSDEN